LGLLRKSKLRIRISKYLYGIVLMIMISYNILLMIMISYNIKIMILISNDMVLIDLKL